MLSSMARESGGGVSPKNPRHTATISHSGVAQNSCEVCRSAPKPKAITVFQGTGQMAMRRAAATEGLAPPMVRQERPA